MPVRKNNQDFQTFGLKDLLSKSASNIRLQH